MLSPAKKGIPESSLASKSSAWKIQMNFLRCFCWCIPWVCAHLGVWGAVVGRIEHWRGIKGTATTHTAKVRAKQVRAPTGECEHRYFRCVVSAMSVRCIVRVWCLTVRIQGVVCIALGVKNATYRFFCPLMGAAVNPEFGMYPLLTNHRLLWTFDTHIILHSMNQSWFVQRVNSSQDNKLKQCSCKYSLALHPTWLFILTRQNIDKMINNW